MYLLGIIVVVITGFILKKTKFFKGERSSFVLELPEYRMPSIKNTIYSVWDRVKAFIIKAGTIIFIASVVIWFLQSFSPRLELVDNPNLSILAVIGNIIAPIFTPLGFGNWESTVALLTSIVAKENVVSTFEIISVGVSLDQYIATMFTPVSGYAFMAFILLSPPCLASIGATKKELHSWKLTAFAIIFQFIVAYLVALIIYQGSRIYRISGSLGPTILIGLIIIALIIFVIRRRLNKSECDGCNHSCGK
jgi:ferrous iron transport protein B